MDVEQIIYRMMHFVVLNKDLIAMRTPSLRDCHISFYPAGRFENTGPTENEECQKKTGFL